MVPRRACRPPRGIPLRASELQLCRVINIVEMINTQEKCWPGFGSITQATALRVSPGRLNDIPATSRADVAAITWRFLIILVCDASIRGIKIVATACETIHELWSQASGVSFVISFYVH